MASGRRALGRRRASRLDGTPAVDRQSAGVPGRDEEGLCDRLAEPRIRPAPRKATPAPVGASPTQTPERCPEGAPRHQRHIGIRTRWTRRRYLLPSRYLLVLHHANARGRADPTHRDLGHERQGDQPREPWPQVRRDPGAAAVRGEGLLRVAQQTAARELADLPGGSSRWRPARYSCA